MKRFYYLSLAVLSITLFNCSTSNVYLNVLKPAQLTIPQHIQKVVILDRTAPENKTANVIEGILTGEGYKQDGKGVENSLASLNQLLSQTQRFEVKRANEKYKGSGSGGSFPSPLAWSTIQDLCKKYDVDAVIALETYDTDWIVTDGVKNIEKKDENGNMVKTKQFYAEGLATVNLGFRLYDNKKTTILDQNHFSRNRVWNATGVSATDALAHLINKTNATNQVSSMAGSLYGERIAPVYNRVSRVFFKKGKGGNEVAAGKRQGDVNDWEGAIETWKRAMNSSNTKNKGRAAYNIAIGYEVLGDLYEAKKWAQRAYTEFGEKKARSYTSILDGRIYDQERLAEQLGE